MYSRPKSFKTPLRIKDIIELKKLSKCYYTKYIYLVKLLSE